MIYDYLNEERLLKNYHKIYNFISLDEIPYSLYNLKEMEFSDSALVKLFDLNINSIKYRYIDKSEEYTDSNGNGIWDPPEELMDINDNGRWDSAEEYVDSNGNGLCDVLEEYVDSNNNGKWDPPEEFMDTNNNGKWDSTEKYVDSNGNGRWDSAEEYKDQLNGIYDVGECFTDCNGNGEWDEGEDFIDTLNCIWDPNEVFIDSNGNDRWDSAEEYIDSNGNGEWDYYAQELYIDSNGNGIWDLGEVFIDSNENGRWDYYSSELYIDSNGNNKFDHAEKLSDSNGNGRWDSAEEYVDSNGNDRWDSAEEYVDSNGNGRWDSGEEYVDSNGNGVRDEARFLEHGDSESRQRTILNEIKTLQTIIQDFSTWRLLPEYVDSNGNGIWDPEEKYVDKGNEKYDLGECFTDCNANGKWDEGEDFIDEGDGELSPPETLLSDNKIRNQRHEVFIESILKKISLGDFLKAYNKDQSNIESLKIQKEFNRKYFSSSHFDDNMSKLNAIVPSFISVGSVEWGKHVEESGTFIKWLFDSIYSPLDTTMFALLAFFVASASYRAFRIRNFEASLLLIAGVLVMIGAVPFGTLIPEWLFAYLFLFIIFAFLAPFFKNKMGLLISFGVSCIILLMIVLIWGVSFLNAKDIMAWIISVPTVAGKKAIMIGVALGIVATSLRIIFGRDKSFLGD